MIGKKFTKINLGGKERTFWFGLGFMGRLIKGTNSTWETIREDIAKDPILMIPEMMYHSMYYAYEREGKEIDFTKFDIIDWIDQGGVEAAKAIELFSLAYRESEESGLPVEDKKKARNKVRPVKKETSKAK